MVFKRVTEEECWFVIGAHQAGASERQCSELSGLSKTIIHKIIRSFKKLGSPHASKLSVEALLHEDTDVDKKRKINEEAIESSPRKRGRPRKPVEPPYFTQALVKQALVDVRDDQKSVYSNKHSIPVYPLDRLNTPPSDEDQLLQTESLRIEKRRESQVDDIPLTPRSGLTADEEEEEEEEVWSMEDDKVLLMHVLGLPLKHVKWKEAENQFQDRHLAKMCADRWEYIKKQMLKDIIDLATSGECNNKKDEFL